MCPLADRGMYNISIDIACLGLVGFIVLSFPTGISLYSGFLESAHTKHAFDILRAAFFSCG